MSDSLLANSAPDELNKRHVFGGSIGLAYLLLSAIGLAGLCAGHVPFAVDLANHATRLFIECNPDDPAFSRMYVVHYDLIPNLAIDLINRPLCGVADPVTVVRGTMVAALAGILFFVWKLHLLLNARPSTFVLLAPAITYNIITGMGYLNYLIGTFLFLAFAWSMLRYRILELHPVWAILIANLFGIILYLCHVFALGLAGVFLFGLRLAQSCEQSPIERTARAALLTAASFAVPFVLILFTPRSGVGIHYTLAGKVRTLWAPMLYSSLWVSALLVFIWFALFLWALREKQIGFAPILRWSLVLTTIFSLILPSGLLNAVDLDSRSLVAVSYLAIAAIGPATMTTIPFETEIAAALVATLTLGLQLGVALPRMFLFNRQVAEFRAASEIFQPYDRVLPTANFAGHPMVPQQFYSHLTSWATRDRKIENPLEFTGKGMQPLQVTKEFACIHPAAASPIGVQVARALANPDQRSWPRQDVPAGFRYAYAWPRSFNYVVYYHFGSQRRLFGGSLIPVREGSFFTIYRTRDPLPLKQVCGI